MKIKALLQSERIFCFVSMNLPPFEFIADFCSCARKQKVELQSASRILGRIPAFGFDLEMNGD